MKVTGIELSPEMAGFGRKRAAGEGRDIDMQVGDAEALDLADESFDTVVCTFGLCSIPDDHLLRELLDPLAEEGFEIEQLKRSKAGFVELVAARKPA